MEQSGEQKLIGMYVIIVMSAFFAVLCGIASFYSGDSQERLGMLVAAILLAILGFGLHKRVKVARVAIRIFLGIEIVIGMFLLPMLLMTSISSMTDDTAITVPTWQLFTAFGFKVLVFALTVWIWVYLGSRKVLEAFGVRSSTVRLNNITNQGT